MSLILTIRLHIIKIPDTKIQGSHFIGTATVSPYYTLTSDTTTRRPSSDGIRSLLGSGYNVFGNPLALRCVEDFSLQPCLCQSSVS